MRDTKPQYEPRWRASERPVKVRLTHGERRRLGVSVAWAVLSPRKVWVDLDERPHRVAVKPVDGWQAVQVWVTEPVPHAPGPRPVPPPAARARGAFWCAGGLHVPTWRTVQGRRRKARARRKSRRGW